MDNFGTCLALALGALCVHNYLSGFKVGPILFRLRTIYAMKEQQKSKSLLVVCHFAMSTHAHIRVQVRYGQASDAARCLKHKQAKT